MDNGPREGADVPKPRGTRNRQNAEAPQPPIANISILGSVEVAAERSSE